MLTRRSLTTMFGSGRTPVTEKKQKPTALRTETRKESTPRVPGDDADGEEDGR